MTLKKVYKISAFKRLKYRLMYPWEYKALGKALFTRVIAWREFLSKYYPKVVINWGIDTLKGHHTPYLSLETQNEFGFNIEKYVRSGTSDDRFDILQIPSDNHRVYKQEKPGIINEII